MSKKDIEKRWNERIVPNGWDKMGAAGAQAYLEKYGKNIGEDKLKAFAERALSLGLGEFANAMLSKTNDNWKEVSLSYADSHGFNGDIIDQYNDYKDDGVKVKIVVTTIGELAKKGAGTLCGAVGNSCYQEIAKKYPNIQIRALYFPEGDGDDPSGCNTPATGSPDMKISSDQEGEEIEDLAYQGGGSLRFDSIGPDGWAYFETE